ncbi:MAG TPA: hypothetical protein VK639_00105, partial [Terriglobales bacterium]|nr:hypothetical protein [Terriglobales bacterium]
LHQPALGDTECRSTATFDGSTPLLLFDGVSALRGGDDHDAVHLHQHGKETQAKAARDRAGETLKSSVVFDDAFAYSDLERVNQLRRMLDLAATRGLQIIVLTCNPADYVALGAKAVALRARPQCLPQS